MSCGERETAQPQSIHYIDVIDKNIVTGDLRGSGRVIRNPSYRVGLQIT
jgi:hypothetical protein